MKNKQKRISLFRHLREDKVLAMNIKRITSDYVDKPTLMILGVNYFPLSQAVIYKSNCELVKYHAAWKSIQGQLHDINHTLLRLNPIATDYYQRTRELFTERSALLIELDKIKQVIEGPEMVYFKALEEHSAGSYIQRVVRALSSSILLYVQLNTVFDKRTNNKKV